MVQAAIIEDNKTAARLLREALEAEGIPVVSVFRSAEEAFAHWQTEHCPPIVFMDLQLPGMSGIEAARKLKAENAATDIIVQTMFEDSESILEAIQAGISGYLLKASPPEELAAAVNEVLRGGAFLTGKVARKILELSTVPAHHSSAQDYQLTKREEEILHLLVEGLSYKAIADRLFLSTYTVNNHLRKVYEKMQVTSRHEAAARAKMTGLSHS